MVKGKGSGKDDSKAPLIDNIQELEQAKKRLKELERRLGEAALESENLEIRTALVTTSAAAKAAGTTAEVADTAAADATKAADVAAGAATIAATSTATVVATSAKNAALTATRAGIVAATAATGASNASKAAATAANAASKATTVAATVTAKASKSVTFAANEAASIAADKAAKATKAASAAADAASIAANAAATITCGAVISSKSAAATAAKAINTAATSAAAEAAKAAAIAARAATKAASEAAEAATIAATTAATAAANAASTAVSAATTAAENAIMAAAIGKYNRNIIETSLDPLIVVDLKKKITDVNATMETATGYPRTKLIGSNFAEFFTEPKEALAGFREALSKGRIRDYVLSIKHKSGRAMHVAYNATAYKDDTGAVKGVIIATRNITKRLKAEEAIKHLASFPRLNMMPILEFNMQGEIVYANPTARSLGKKLNITNDALWLPQDWREKAQTAKKTHHPIQRTVINLGQMVFLEQLHYVSEFDVLRAYLTDVTKLSETEDALRLNETQLRQIIDLMPQLIYVRDWDEKLLMSNKAFEDFYGYAEGVPVCELGALIEDDRKIMLEGDTVTLSETVYDAAGERHDMGSTKVPYSYTGAEGQQTYAVLGVSQDLTEVVRYERTKQETLEKLKATLNGTVNTVLAISNMRDPYTSGHEARVASLAVAISSELGRSNEEAEELRIICVLHDIGKIYVPAEILSKPGSLTKIEFDMIKEHSRIGFEIIKEALLPPHISETILQHHERLDGSGYPNGIKGDAISLDARILGVADVVEAMTSHRPYRAALGIDKALAEIEGNKGKLYDPDIVKICLSLFRVKKFEFTSANQL